MPSKNSNLYNKPRCKNLTNTLLLLPLITIALPSAAESFTAKRISQGFTGITQDFTSSLSNPALLTKFDDDDDVFFSLNLGVMAADENGVVESIEDIADDLDDLVDGIDALSPQNPETDDLYDQADAIIADFEDISGDIVKARNGLNLQILIPNKHLSLGIFVNQYGRYAGRVEYDSADEDTINNAIANGINGGELDLKDLNSVTRVGGYSIAEAGVMLAYPIVNHVNYELNIGTKIKYQRVDLYYNPIAVEDFDDDDFEPTDDEYITDGSGANVDLGLSIAWGDERQWNAALVANNLIGQSVTHEDQDITFDLDSSATLGLSYQNSWVTLAGELDLTDREHFDFIAPSKYAGVGAEFRLGEHFQLRAGYRSDLNDVDEDIVTAGIGISPWDVFSIDLGGFYGENDTLGAALQVSLKL